MKGCSSASDIVKNCHKYWLGNKYNTLIPSYLYLLTTYFLLFCYNMHFFVNIN